MSKITKIQIIRTRADGSWVIVKVLTDQPGLYGIGSASDVRHPETVVKAVETIAPLLIGREAGRIEDNWQSVYTSGYWRNGSILNTALGGIDMALWDIKGKEAGMPVYDLLGGPCRAAVPCYAHAGGDDLARAGGGRAPLHGGGLPGHPLPARPVRRRRVPRRRRSQTAPRTPGRADGAFDDEAYLENIPAHVRITCAPSLGFGVKLTHDVHEHLRPHNAVPLAKLLEPYRLFFLEDVLSPEQIALVPPDPPAVHHAAGHGRVVRQPARVDAADHASG